MRRTILVLAALLALGTGGTAALAASGAKEKPRAAVAVNARGGMLQAAATYLGLDRKVLLGQLRSGKSLAQVAQARNKSVAGLETAILNAFKAKVDKAVAARRLKSDRAKKLVAAAPAAIHRLVTHVPKAQAAKRRRARWIPEGRHRLPRRRPQGARAGAAVRQVPRAGRDREEQVS